MIEGKVIGWAITGSFCTIPEVFEKIEKIVSDKAKVIPIVSERVAKMNTRMGKATDIIEKLEKITGNKVITDINGAEPIGPKKMLDVLIILPATGNTIAKMANGIIDSSVLMAAKAHMRNGRPLVVAPATNDGLSGSMANIGVLMNRKNVYFVPYGQDDAINKPASLIADFGQIVPACEAALEGKQIQPVLVPINH